MPPATSGSAALGDLGVFTLSPVSPAAGFGPSGASDQIGTPDIFVRPVEAGGMMRDPFTLPAGILHIECSCEKSRDCPQLG
jgi:hypothetical protein